MMNWNELQFGTDWTLKSCTPGKEISVSSEFPYTLSMYMPRCPSDPSMTYTRLACTLPFVHETFTQVSAQETQSHRATGLLGRANALSQFLTPRGRLLENCCSKVERVDLVSVKPVGQPIGRGWSSGCGKANYELGVLKGWKCQLEIRCSSVYEESICNDFFLWH